jgi:hypothetical protein
MRMVLVSPFQSASQNSVTRSMWPPNVLPRAWRFACRANATPPSCVGTKRHTNRDEIARDRGHILCSSLSHESYPCRSRPTRGRSSFPCLDYPRRMWWGFVARGVGDSGRGQWRKQRLGRCRNGQRGSER